MVAGTWRIEAGGAFQTDIGGEPSVVVCQELTGHVCTTQMVKEVVPVGVGRYVPAGRAEPAFIVDGMPVVEPAPFLDVGLVACVGDLSSVVVLVQVGVVALMRF